MTIQVGRFFSDYDKTKSLLKILEFDVDENIALATSLKKSDLSQDFIRASVKSDYREIYKIARDTQSYNLLLNSDGSFFQFGYQKDQEGKISDLRYAYFEAPFEQISYEDFLLQSDLTIEECGAEFYEEYTQYITEAELKSSVTPIRYDYSEEQYTELLHPASHIHIGQLNQIRLPLSFVMTPLNFVAFVIRHIYWHKWKVFMGNASIRTKYLDAYNSVIAVNRNAFSHTEEKDIYLKL